MNCILLLIRRSPVRTAIFLTAFLSCTYAPKHDLLGEARARVALIPPSWHDEPVIMIDDSVMLTVVPQANGENHLAYDAISYLYVVKRNPTLLEHLVFVENWGIEQPPSITVTVLYPDGGKWRSSPDDFSVSNRLFLCIFRTDDKEYALSIPNYTEGMVIRVQENRTYTAPEHMSFEFLRGEYPALHKYIRLSHPPGYSIVRLFSNREGLTVDTLRTISDKSVSFIAESRSLPKLQGNNRLRNPENWYAGLHFAIPPRGQVSHTWQQLGDHYLASIAKVFVPSRKISAWTDNLKGKSPDTLIAAAFEQQLRNVRYFANLENAHGYIPRPAATVAENGYGDCKEMAVLLKATLAVKGVDLGLALVSTEGNVQCIEQIPSLGTFNHCIAYFMRKDSSLAFLDPTVSFGTAANSYFHLIGQNAFVLQDGRSRVVRIEQGPDYQNLIETSSKITQSTITGKWEIAGSILLRGNCAYLLSPLFYRMKGEDEGPFVSRFLADAFGVQAATSSVKRNTSDHVEITFTAPFQRNYLSMDKGGLLMTTPSLFGGDIRYTTLSYEGPRYFAKYDQRDCWEVPAGFGDLESRSLDHRLGRGSWSAGRGMVRRSFSQNEATIDPGERDTITDYFARRSAFVKATVWR